MASSPHWEIVQHEDEEIIQQHENEEMLLQIERNDPERTRVGVVVDLFRSGGNIMVSTKEIG